MANILLADDEPLFAMTTAQFLEENGYTVLCREDGEQAEVDMANNRIDLVIVDLDMPVIESSKCLTIATPPSANSVDRRDRPAFVTFGHRGDSSGNP